MAYESLADRYREVENDINPSQGTSGGGSSTVPLDEQSPDIPQSIADLYKPFSRVAQKITFGNPTTTDYSLQTGQFNNIETFKELDQEKIKKRKVD